MAKKAATKGRVVEAAAVMSGNKDKDLAHRKEQAMVQAILEGQEEGLDYEEMRDRIREASASVTE